jgi:hypothetical protein
MARGSADEAAEREPAPPPDAVTSAPTQPRTPWQRLSRDTRALLIVAAAVVLANLPYVVGVFDADPLGPRSGLVTAVTPGPLMGQPTIDPNNGFISQALTHRAALDLVHLQWPWWNPYQATGAPLAGDMQSAALFPPSLLTLLRNGQLYERMLLEIVAGLATFLLLRRLSVNRWAAVPAAVAFALNGTFAWFSHAAVNPVAFLPLLLLGIETAYAASIARRAGGWWLIAVAGAMSFYAGFPEVAYLDALFAGAWLIWRCVRLDRARVAALGGKVAAGAVVGVLLAAPLLVTSIHFLGQTDLQRHDARSFGDVHLPFSALPQLVLPYVHGPIFGATDSKFVILNTWGGLGGFLSTSLLLFGLLGLLSPGRRGLRLVLSAWIVLALPLMYASPPVLTEVVGALPGMSRVIFSRYAFPSVELAVIILAALGLDALVTSPASRRRMLVAAGASLGLVALAAIVARPLAEEAGVAFSHRPYFPAAVLWGAGVVAIGAAAAVVRSRDRRMLLIGLVVVGDALLLFATPQLSAPRQVQTDLAPVAFLQQHLGLSRVFGLGPLAPNYGSYFGIASLNNDDFPSKVFASYVRDRLDRYADATVFVGSAGGGRSPFVPSPRDELLRNLDGYRAAGVAYVLTPAGQPLPTGPGSFTLAARTPTTWIYHLAGAAPYFGTTRSGCTVRPHGRQRVSVSCPAPTVLVRRESDSPDWSARVDGREIPIHPDSGLFQAVDVGAGSHEVTFSYAPPNVRWGLVGLAAGCAWLLAAAVLTRRRTPGPRGHHPEARG